MAGNDAVTPQPAKHRLQRRTDVSRSLGQTVRRQAIGMLFDELPESFVVRRKNCFERDLARRFHLRSCRNPRGGSEFVENGLAFGALDAVVHTRGNYRSVFDGTSECYNEHKGNRCPKSALSEHRELSFARLLFRLE